MRAQRITQQVAGKEDLKAVEEVRIHPNASESLIVRYAYSDIMDSINTKEGTQTIFDHF